MAEGAVGRPRGPTYSLEEQAIMMVTDYTAVVITAIMFIYSPLCAKFSFKQSFLMKNVKSEILSYLRVSTFLML